MNPLTSSSPLAFSPCSANWGFAQAIVVNLNYILAMMAFIKPLFGIRFDDKIKYFSSDHHVLRSLIFDLKFIKEGHSKRTINVDSAPIHPNTLRNF
jgi:hypothetical protein